MNPHQYQNAPAPYPQQGYAPPQGYAPAQPPQGYAQPAAPAFNGHQQPPLGYNPGAFAGAPGPAPQGFFTPPGQRPAAPMDVRQGGFFRGIEQAQATKNSNYIKPGHYWARIDKCKIDQARDRVNFWAAEMTIVRVIDNAQNSGHNVGEAATRLVKQSNDYFLPEAKSFVAGVLGMQPEQITEENCIEIFGPAQPLAGTIVEIKTWAVQARKTGNMITKITWVREVSAAEALATLSPQAREAFFPNQTLERLAAAEQQQKPAAPVAPQGSPQYPAPTAPQPGYAPTPTPAGYPQPQPPAQAPAPLHYPQQPPMVPPGGYAPPAGFQPAPQTYSR